MIVFITFSLTAIFLLSAIKKSHLRCGFSQVVFTLSIDFKETLFSESVTVLWSNDVVKARMFSINFLL